VKKWLKSVYIYGSYRKIKTGVPLFLDHSVYTVSGKKEANSFLWITVTNVGVDLDAAS